MKKNNSYIADDEIDLADLIKSLWKEKILVLSITIICGLLGYFYGLSKIQELRTEIVLKDPPIQIFDSYNSFSYNDNNIVQQFVSDFKLNLLSLDNLENFIEESREFDNFKGYLKSRNISAKQYISDLKFAEVKEKNLVIPNKYFLNHSKELDGTIFLNKYVEFIKKKTIVELKNNLKLTLLDAINHHEEASEIAKKIELEYPIIQKLEQGQVVAEPDGLFYKGTKVLSENINHLKQRLKKLENDQFDYNIILQKPITFPNNPKNSSLHFALGLMLGLFLSLGIIYFKGIIRND